MKFIKEFNIFDDILENQDPNIDEIVELFYEKVDKFLDFDPNWYQYTSNFKINILTDKLEVFFNRYFDDFDDQSYLDTFLNSKNIIINKIIEKLDKNFN